MATNALCRFYLVAQRRLISRHPTPREEPMSTVTATTQQIQHLIGPDSEPASSDETFESRDPHDGSLLAEVARGTIEDADRVITVARRAFDQGPWPRMDVAERGRLLNRLADLLEAEQAELALLETRDTGRPISATGAYDVARAAQNFRFFADYVEHVGNQAYPSSGRLTYVLYPPAGVVAAISPWNFPLMLSSWKVAPALAFGNSVVLKPAEQTPLTATRLGQLALEAGIPDGVLNVVHGFGPGEIGEALTTDPRVDRITFTGASATGSAIMAAAARNLTAVSFELGGRSANIVFGDADLEQAVPGSVRAIFSNNGAMCLAGSRLLVQREILAEFTARFVELAGRLRIGDPKDPRTEVGPLIERTHLDKVHAYVELGQQEGGELLLGGRPVPSAGELYYQPTVLGSMTNQMRAVREEIFGPVQTLIPFDDEREAMQIANDTPYGLAGMLWTRDLDRAHRMAADWKAGNVWINCFFERELRAPFGGEGRSGIGREGGSFSREFFTEPRAVVVKHHSAR
jgi:aminomuconate-semialdehyde/2-hydroxymuconate-6-semialdehyde dehydrogenase